MPVLVSFRKLHSFPSQSSGQSTDYSSQKLCSAHEKDFLYPSVNSAYKLRRDDQYPNLPASVHFFQPTAPSIRLPVPSRNCAISATSDWASNCQFPLGSVVLVASDPNNQLEVPSWNFEVLAANLQGSSPEKLRNPCLLTLHATRHITFENCANLVVQPLLTIHSGKFTEHAYLSHVQPELYLPKFAPELYLPKFVQVFLPAKPYLADSHCWLKVSVSISQWLLHSFHQ